MVSGVQPQQVRQLFEQVAPHYDRLNDLLSLGLHRLWKRQMVQLLQPKAGEAWLDLCCGTGDLALLLAERLRPAGTVLAIDAAEAPLQRARLRAASRSWLAIDWQLGDALAVDCPDGHFDGAVMAYGLRNLADPARGLREMRRLLHTTVVRLSWISTAPQAWPRCSSARPCAKWWFRWPPSWGCNRNTPTSKAVLIASPQDLSRSNWLRTPASVGRAIAPSPGA